MRSAAGLPGPFYPYLGISLNARAAVVATALGHPRKMQRRHSAPQTGLIIEFAWLYILHPQNWSAYDRR